jgi:hypothetical protein
MQTIVKSIHFPFSVGIQIFDPLVLEIDFSLQSRSLLAKFH